MSRNTPESAGAQPPAAPGVSAPERRTELTALFHRARGCTLCPQLVAGRTQVVFGAGNPDADLMFVGEAPGAREDEQGVPFVGASGKLLDELLGSIGLERADVFIANVLKCRPPGNRDPAPAEITRCRPYLHEQIALIQPRVVCTLGNFSTKLLRGDNTGIKELHGQAEVRVLGQRAVHLLPLYHPAAALYQRSLVDTLRADIALLPELLARAAPPQPEPVAEVAEDAALVEEGAARITDPQASQGPVPPGAAGSGKKPPDEPDEPAQLGLF